MTRSMAISASQVQLDSIAASSTCRTWRRSWRGHARLGQQEDRRRGKGTGLLPARPLRSSRRELATVAADEGE